MCEQMCEKSPFSVIQNYALPVFRSFSISPLDAQRNFTLISAAEAAAARKKMCTEKNLNLHLAKSSCLPHTQSFSLQYIFHTSLFFYCSFFFFAFLALFRPS